jgi:hypothetical protein
MTTLIAAAATPANMIGVGRCGLMGITPVITPVLVVGAELGIIGATNGPDIGVDTPRLLAAAEAKPGAFIMDPAPAVGVSGLTVMSPRLG